MLACPVMPSGGPARRSSAVFGTPPRPRTARRVLLAAPALLASLLLVSAAADPVGAQSDESDLELADRIVAVVDEDPILASDIQQVIELGLMERLEGEDDNAFERRILDEIIVTRLRFHEVDRFGVRELPLSRVEAQYRQIRARYEDEASFEAALAEVGLGADELKELLARQLIVLTFVEERLGPRVFVSLDDIRRYYDDVLTPEMERRGEPVPELPAVREQIRAVLREQRLNTELEIWTEELRLHADITVNLERGPRELPPVVER